MRTANLSLQDYCVQRQELRLLSQWDREENAPLIPENVSPGSHKKIWWCCEQGHRWQAAVYARTGGSGCPYCTGRKRLPGTGTLASDAPELAAQWHPVKNGPLTPGQIPPATHRKAWWVCAWGHEWQARVNSRVRGSGCPFCTNRAVLTGENDLAVTHPQLAGEWHPSKNGALHPGSVTAGSRKRVWWQCAKGHEWQVQIQSRSRGGSGCPVCAGKRVVPGENDLASRFPQIAAQWHPTRNGAKKPESVTAFSNLRAWWVCNMGHEYLCAIAHRTQSAVGCPYCAGRKVLAGFNDLETKNPQVAAQWDGERNGALTPRMVTAGSHKKVWWRCSLGHVWKAAVYARAGKQQNGCPVCAGKVRQKTV